MRVLGRLAMGVAMAVGVAGCRTEPMAVADPVELPGAFSASGEVAVEQAWWRAFGDEGLDRAVEAAFAGNFTLATAWDRLAQAEAIAKREGAALYPQVDVLGSGERVRRDLARGTSYETGLLAGLTVGYEVDLWGRIRSAREAAAYSAAASEQEVQAAALTLAASVATTWYRLAEARGQVAVLEEQIATNRSVLELVTERFRQGQVQAADVLRQRQLVQATEGLRTVAVRAVTLLEHQLAVLVGERPKAELGLGEATLAEVGALPATGVPAELLERRPDVRRAYLAVLGQDRSLASAIAAQYPRVSLSAGVSTSSARVRDLFDDWAANLAGNVAEPLFDGGRLAAEADRNRALLSERVHAYGQTVLEALAEVEDALAQEAGQRAYLASLAEQLASADAVIERTRASYLNGQLDYLRVLEALTSRQGLERTYLTARREAIEFRVGLYRALAGGEIVMSDEL